MVGSLDDDKEEKLQYGLIQVDHSSNIGGHDSKNSDTNGMFPNINLLEETDLPHLMPEDENEWDYFYDS